MSMLASEILDFVTNGKLAVGEPALSTPVSACLYSAAASVNCCYVA
jgi:hypothetical protein